MARTDPPERDRAEAVRRLLSGLIRGQELLELASVIEPLHPRNNTFPGEVYLGLAGQALEQAGIGPHNPIAYAGLLDRYLPEHSFRGRENRKIRFAILAGAAARDGIEPDLLDELTWWQTDDFWFYALTAALVVVRVCAQRAGQSVPVFTEQLRARTPRSAP